MPYSLLVSFQFSSNKFLVSVNLEFENSNHFPTSLIKYVRSGQWLAHGRDVGHAGILPAVRAEIT